MTILCKACQLVPPTQHQRRKIPTLTHYCAPCRLRLGNSDPTVKRDMAVALTVRSEKRSVQMHRMVDHICNHYKSMLKQIKKNRRKLAKMVENDPGLYEDEEKKTITQLKNIETYVDMVYDEMVLTEKNMLEMEIVII